MSSLSDLPGSLSLFTPVGVRVFQYSVMTLAYSEGDFRLFDIWMPRFFPLVREVTLVADVDQELHLLSYWNCSPACKDIVILTTLGDRIFEMRMADVLPKPRHG